METRAQARFYDAAFRMAQHSALGCAGRPLVNFDVALGELVREAKWLGRLGCEVPEAARRVLLQEHKFKFYYSRLHFLLRARGSSHHLVPSLLSQTHYVIASSVSAEWAPPSASHNRKLTILHPSDNGVVSTKVTCCH